MNTQQQNITHMPHDEMILVVKREDIFPLVAWQGLQEVTNDYFLDIVRTKHEFQPRSLMEQDPTYKQIIPYLIFNYEDKYFLMQRQAKATETRLQNKYSLGIGGHIRSEDIQGDDIAQWARREFDEEVSYTGNYTIKLIGILNDDSNAVGQVHIGFVYLLTGDSADIRIKEELKSGTLSTLEECYAVYDNLETWSQIVLSYLDQKVHNYQCCGSHTSCDTK